MNYFDHYNLDQTFSGFQNLVVFCVIGVTKKLRQQDIFSAKIYHHDNPEKFGA